MSGQSDQNDQGYDERDDEYIDLGQQRLVPSRVIRTVARKSAPGFSIPFLLIFAVCAYFHESRTVEVSALLGIWLGLQCVSAALGDDFQQDVFWGLIGGLGNALFFLLIGHAWSWLKLWLDVRMGHLPPVFSDQLAACLPDGPDGCLLTFLFDIKFLVVQWTIMWPLSVIYTLSRDPLKMATDLAFEWSTERYMWVIRNAYSSSRTGQDNQWFLLTFFGGICVYLAVGYIWTHAKLFIDVWQGRLPSTLEKQLRQVVAGDSTYWAFVRNAKWLIMQWVITWPFSLVHTLLRDPVRIVVEFLYRLSQRKYVAITQSAMELRLKQDRDGEKEE